MEQPLFPRPQACPDGCRPLFVTTVTLNPCIDRTVEVQRLAEGGTNRVLASRTDLSGKGVNVSIALQQMGLPTRCVSFQHRGGELGRFLAERKIPALLAGTQGELRVNLKLFDRSQSRMTELNERGSAVAEHEVRDIFELVKQSLADSCLLVLSGSIPPGMPEDCYRTLAQEARRAGCPVLLDASGPALRRGVEASPVLIKPNCAELEAAFGLPAGTPREAAASCRKIQKTYGVRLVCCSMGEAGALLISREKTLFSPGAPIRVRGVQGAGDSMVAGFCAAFLRGGLTPAQLLQWAVAAAHASLEKEGTQMCDEEGFSSMLPRIPVEEVDF